MIYISYFFKVLYLEIWIVTPMATESKTMRTMIESVKKIAVLVRVSQSMVRM